MSGRYKWVIGEPPPVLRVHSLAKHEVLRAYLTRYIQILASRPVIHKFKWTLIDGFAGGGVYRHEITKAEVPGSPLIMLEATRKVAGEIADQRNEFHLDADYFFVEQDKKTFAYLKWLLAQRGADRELGERLILRQGAFADELPGIIEFIQKKGGGCRALFVLDQFGYTDVPLSLLREIFSKLPKAEVILTFAVDALADFLSDTDQSRKMMAAVGLHLDLGDFAKTKGATDRRFYIQSRIAPALHENSGAKFFTPFFIVSRESNRHYWLVHLSMHERARDEMARLHWDNHTLFTHNGGAGLGMLGYDPANDDKLSLQSEFDFDAVARKRSLDQLRRDIPEELVKHRNGIKFGDLFRATVNGTPAISDFYRQTFDNLLSDKEIEIRTPNGGIRRKGHSIHNEDTIIVRRPSLFFRFPNKKE